MKAKFLLTKIISTACLTLILLATAAAQEAQATDTTAAVPSPSLRLQHSAALSAGKGGSGFVYDLRFRTQMSGNPLTHLDYYAQANIQSFTSGSIGGGLLLGDFHGFSVAAGANLVRGLPSSNSYNRTPESLTALSIEVPLAIRYQRSGSDLFASLGLATSMPLSGEKAGVFAFAPQIQLGWAFGKIEGHEPRTGIQHTPFLFYGSYSGLGLAYDARIRREKGVDFAFGGGWRSSFPYNNSINVNGPNGPESRTFQQSASGAGYVEGLVLFGKRHVAFETGMRFTYNYASQKTLNSLDYKTGEIGFNKTQMESMQIGVPIMFRYQPPSGGVFFKAGVIPSMTMYSNNQNLSYPYFPDAGSFNLDGSIGVGYTFKTR